MKISKDKVVSISYKLETTNAEGAKVLVEEVSTSQPMVFLFGAGNLIQRFEDNLENKIKGDGFEFMIPSDEGYGEYDFEAIVKLPVDVFKVNGEFDREQFQPGTVVPMTDQDGNFLRGKIMEVSDQEVQVDFNHPMAGQDLYFKGAVVDVREATGEEIEHGHVHGPGGHHH